MSSYFFLLEMQNDVLRPSLPSSQSALINGTVKSQTRSTLQYLKELSSKRRALLAKCLGARSSDHLSSLLGTAYEKEECLKRSKQCEQLKLECDTISSSLEKSISTTKCENADRDFNRLRNGTTISKEEKVRKKDEQVKKVEKLTSDEKVRREEKVKKEEKLIKITDVRLKGNDGKLSSTKNDGQEGKAFIVAKRDAVLNLDAPQPAAKRARARGAFNDDDEVESFEDYFQVLQEEERVFRGSISFLKGTQSANPHNDYSQHFVDTGQRPQNFIRDAGLYERFDEYPKLKELIKLKDELVANTATPPMYLRVDLHTFDLVELGSRFDVIIIEPPLPEYYHVTNSQCWTWDQIEQLDVPSLADSRCFLWLWCGSTPDGLDRGRQCFKRWGFRRCEDICWVKRNSNSYASTDLHKSPLDASALFQRTKEHCLMGIKGTVRRSTDGDFIHANVDIDLIITEEPSGDVSSLEKPAEIFLIAEHFCLGRRRLHLFGRDDTIRPGWLTVGPSLTTSNFDARKYRRQFVVAATGGTNGSASSSLTTGCTERVEALRPKSPPPPSAPSSVQQTSSLTAAVAGTLSSQGGSSTHSANKLASTLALDKIRRKHYGPVSLRNSSNAFGRKSSDRTRRRALHSHVTSQFRQYRNSRTMSLSANSRGNARNVFGMVRRHQHYKKSVCDNRRR